MTQYNNLQVRNRFNNNKLRRVLSSKGTQWKSKLRATV